MLNELNYLAIVVAAVLVFVFSAIYYTLLARQGAELGAAWATRARPAPWMIGVQEPSRRGGRGRIGRARPRGWPQSTPVTGS